MRRGGPEAYFGYCLNENRQLGIWCSVRGYQPIGGSAHRGDSDQMCGGGKKLEEKICFCLT